MFTQQEFDKAVDQYRDNASEELLNEIQQLLVKNKSTAAFSSMLKNKKDDYDPKLMSKEDYEFGKKIFLALAAGIGIGITLATSQKFSA